jgi:hypothetical protein
MQRQCRPCRPDERVSCVMTFFTLRTDEIKLLSPSDQNPQIRPPFTKITKE